MIGRLVGAVARALTRTSAFDRAAASPLGDAPARPAELEQLERTVLFSQSTAGDVHRRLRPVLRHIAQTRLREGRGVDLDAEPDAARRLLGEPLYDLVRLDRPPPENRFFLGGMRADDLDQMIDRLEDL